MPLAPLQLQPIIDRIASQCRGDGDGFYREVSRAADRQTVIDSGEFAKPGAFILEPAYNASSQAPGGASGLVQQNLGYELGVLTGVQNYAGKTGEEQSKEAEVLRGKLFAALVGWAPFTAGFEIEAGAGQLLLFTEQVYWYLDTFRLPYFIRST